MTLFFSLVFLLPFLFLSLHLFHEIQALLRTWSIADAHWHPLATLQNSAWFSRFWSEIPASWRDNFHAGALRPDLNAWAARVGVFAGGLGKVLGTPGLIWISTLVFYRHGESFLQQGQAVPASLLGQQFPQYLQTVGNTLRAVVYQKAP